MPANQQNLRVGVYVDVANIAQNGGYGMHYNILREFACRGESTPIRLNAYVAHDAERAREDPAYRDGQRGFHDVLREQGFKVIVKNVKWYSDERGGRIGKSNADMDLAVDALQQSQNMDRVVLATGDGDFVEVVHALQNRGCRVEVVAFDNVSSELRREADMFTSGYQVPGLLPSLERGPKWGEIGSRVRGVCYYFKPEKGYGFLRFMHHISDNLWDVDSRKPGSPYQSVFFHVSELPNNFPLIDLPSREIVFEFELIKAAKKTEMQEQEGLQALKMHVIRGGHNGVRVVQPAVPAPEV
jgi:uncharacterized LabA/DUF88 family protein